MIIIIMFALHETRRQREHSNDMLMACETGEHKKGTKPP